MDNFWKTFKLISDDVLDNCWKTFTLILDAICPTVRQELIPPEVLRSEVVRPEVLRTEIVRPRLVAKTLSQISIPASSPSASSPEDPPLSAFATAAFAF